MQFPAELGPYLEGCEAEGVEIGMSTSDVFRMTRDGCAEWVVKRAPVADRDALEDEAARLRWLDGRAPVPRVAAFTVDDGHAYLLMEALPGRDATVAAARSPEAIVRGMARALRELHAQPVDGCPFDERLDAKIRAAHEHACAGLVDEMDFDEERLGVPVDQLLDQLERDRPKHEDLVLTHGDACLPNYIFDGDRFTGFVDCGRFGVADRYQDLALAARSTIYNLGPDWVQPFFDAYGLPQPDEGLLAYYRLLDEFP
ncbi:MAG: aminoglycoside 3'-phosphotransferase [bacterium]|nr:aminoglycoside 3'-phosphotransferase [bacterium]